MRRILALGLLLLTASVGRGEVPSREDYDARIKPADRLHWSFQPVRRPPVPPVRDAAWARNPIDNFILARLEAEGWKPNPPVEPHVLLRRVSLDLTGLPPTLEEQEAFLADPSSADLDRVVNDLLARPQYGERWGRHWLDLARYAESNGYERDAAKPHAWRYRDYVLRAFNADKPMDRFILEQIAGDELPDADAETLIATGFARLGPWDDEPADPKEDRFDQLDDVVHTTSQVFLGLTLACARCHDHKFEPLTILDYYRMVAVFNPLQRPQKGRTDLDLPAGTRAQLRDAKAQAALPRGYFFHEPSPQAPPTHLLIRGQASRPGPEVAPGLPAVLVARQPAFLPPDALTSRRRLTLARWIASPDNPLTARVLVNRVWQWHFGEGLVRTPSDFGVLGEAPTHPELLDWLADWFVREGGWSLKKLHRLILSSQTYRMGKRLRAGYAARDPDNRLGWRLPYRRLEAEAIRDSALAVSGQLNRQMYGPSMFPEVPKEALEGHSDPDKVWQASGEREASRRTVYAFLKRSMLVPLLEVLDLCDTTKTAARRNVTSVAPQALALWNGDFINRQARHLVLRLEREAGPDPARQIDLAFRLALCRPPTPAERDAMLRLRALEGMGQVCRVLLNLNEFVYPD